MATYGAPRPDARGCGGVVVCVFDGCGERGAVDEELENEDDARVGSTVEGRFLAGGIIVKEKSKIFLNIQASSFCIRSYGYWLLVTPSHNVTTALQKLKFL
jgi:hypothetical protein